MNRNILDFSLHANKDRTQDIIKWIEKPLEHKPEDKGNVENLTEIPQGKSLPELKAIKGAITEKSSETVEHVNEDKESEFIEDDHSMKTCTQIVTELEEGVSKTNKESSIKEKQEVGENNMRNVVNKQTTQTIPLGYSNSLGHNTAQKIIAGANLNSAMKSVSPYIPSDLSRNSSDTISTTSSLQARKPVSNPCRKKSQRH